MLRRAQIISTVLELLGIVAVVIGVGLFSIPVAFIVGGCAVGIVGYALGSEATT
jgi:protein-S-isoprenylcysteine O-methyltransferase Ste14